jgi:hypothetical protein
VACIKISSGLAVESRFLPVVLINPYSGPQSTPDAYRQCALIKHILHTHCVELLNCQSLVPCHPSSPSSMSGPMHALPAVLFAGSPTSPFILLGSTRYESVVHGILHVLLAISLLLHHRSARWFPEFGLGWTLSFLASPPIMTDRTSFQVQLLQYLLAWVVYRFFPSRGLACNLGPEVVVHGLIFFRRQISTFRH